MPATPRGHWTRGCGAQERGLAWRQDPNLLTAFMAMDEVLREPDGVRRSGDRGQNPAGPGPERASAGEKESSKGANQQSVMSQIQGHERRLTSLCVARYRGHSVLLGKTLLTGLHVPFPFLLSFDKIDISRNA